MFNSTCNMKYVNLVNGENVTGDSYKNAFNMVLTKKNLLFSSS